MDASNKPDHPDGPGLATLAGSRAAAVRGLWTGAIGHTVRCVPTRRTVAAQVDGEWLFGKWHIGRAREAAAEWRWLHLLPLLGLRTAEPLAWLGGRRRSLVVTVGLRGRALDAWAIEAERGGWLEVLVDYACKHVAPAVRRLHDHGLTFRDLYWNHLFAEEPVRGGPPTFLDVSRVQRPRWRWHRWVVKDLAGLWASVPVAVPKRSALRFLRSYLGGPIWRHRRLVFQIERKANVIRRHVPRFG